MSTKCVNGLHEKSTNQRSTYGYRQNVIMINTGCQENILMSTQYDDDQHEMSTKHAND